MMTTTQMMEALQLLQEVMAWLIAAQLETVTETLQEVEMAVRRTQEARLILREVAEEEMSSVLKRRFPSNPEKVQEFHRLIGML